MAATDSSAWLQAKADGYAGQVVTITAPVLLKACEDLHHARQALTGELDSQCGGWKRDGVRGVWLHIKGASADTRLSLAGAATSAGFRWHHARPDEAVLVRWLPTGGADPDVLPRGGTHVIAAAGLVVSPQDEVLVVKERWPTTCKGKWKLPGGVVDPGEGLGAAAVREVAEETGVQCDFSHVLAMRHFPRSRWGLGDLYTVCVLLPHSKQLSPCPHEIADAAWMPLADFLSATDVHPFNRQLVAMYVQHRVHMRHSTGVLRQLTWGTGRGACDVYAVEAHLWEGKTPPALQDSDVAHGAAGGGADVVQLATSTHERALASKAARRALANGHLPPAWRSAEVVTYVQRARGGGRGGGIPSTTISSIVSPTPAKRAEGGEVGGGDTPPATQAASRAWFGFVAGVSWGVATAAVAVAVAARVGLLSVGGGVGVGVGTP